uniref:FLYWCH-type domain-containing protein n=1 Tax=Panagrolaimus davidi TaxID=227884 RepID=A0A914PP50_9BILA
MHRIEIIKVKEKNGIYYWQCKNYKKCKCNGRAITNSIQPNAILIGGNFDHTCIPNLQSNIPMPTTPTSMPYYSDPITAAYGTPPLTTSVSVAATPSISSLINSEDPNMLKARVFVGNLNASLDSREMLCNENLPISYDRVLVNDFPQLDLIVIYYVTIGIIALIFIHIALYSGEDSKYYTYVPAEDDKQATSAPIPVAPAAADILL